MPKNKAIFLDRDGVINKNRDDYVKNITEFIFLPNVFSAINQLNKMGFLIIIITNQSAVNRGIISHKQLDEIHSFMLNEFKKNSCEITKIYYCPHGPNENCLCRKPKTGLLKQAISDFDIDISKSWLIGDKKSDILAAEQLSLNSVLVDDKTNLLSAIDIIRHKIT